MAAGYWAMLAKQPELRAGENFARAFAAARSHKLREQQMEQAKQRAEAEAAADRQAKEQAALEKQEKQNAGVMRFWSNAVQRNPELMDRARADMERRGIDVPVEMQQQVANPQLQGPAAPGGVAPYEVTEPQANPNAYAMELAARSSAILGPPSPERQPKLTTDAIAKQVDLGTAYQRGTDEWRNEYNRRLAAQQSHEERVSPGGDIETKMRTKFEASPIYREGQEVATAWQKIRNSEATAAGDLAMLINYMKLLDPGSVVREGELWTAQKSRGYSEEIEGLIERVRSGRRMTDAQRADFLRQASRQFAAQKSRYERFAKNRIWLAKQYDANPDLVVLDPSLGAALDRAQSEGGRTQPPPPGIADTIRSHPNLTPDERRFLLQEAGGD